MRALGRRALLALPLALLALPLALSGCGSDDGADQRDYPPLRYADLGPIQLNVASIEVRQLYIPSGVPPDVSAQAPVSPIEALRAMANDRLQAFGTANKAVFAILNASLVQEGDVVRGDMAVSLTITDNDGARLGFAEARVSQRHTGRSRNLRATLYDMVKSMMWDINARSMNIELEYQILRGLKDWLTSPAAPDAPVQQDPLEQPERR